MKKKRFLPFAFNLLLSLTCFSQSIESTIQWIKETDNNKPVSFDEAIYTNKNNLPYYQKVIPVNDHYSYDVELLNTTFEKTNQPFQDNSAIEENIQLKTSVFRSRNQSYLTITFLPVIKTPFNEYKLLKNFEIRLNRLKSANTMDRLQKSADINYTDNSVLSSGKWVKVKVSGSGVYKINYNELEDMGFSNPEGIRVFGNGGKQLSFKNADPRPDDLLENAIYIEKGSDNAFNEGDYILFYGQGPVTWEYDKKSKLFRHQIHDYAGSSYYFLTTDAGTGKKIETANALEGQATHQVNTFVGYDYHEINRYNLLHSGRQFFGEKFDAEIEFDFDFYLRNLMTDKPVTIAAAVAGRSISTNRFDVYLNGSSIGNISPPSIYDYQSTEGYYARFMEKIFRANSNTDDIGLTVTYNKSDVKSEGYMDYITINGTRELAFTSPQMHFCDTSHIGPRNIGEFSIYAPNQNLTVWDISDIHQIKEMETSRAGDLWKFTAETEEIRRYIAFDGSSFRKIENFEEIDNQNLHQPEALDYLIVYHPDFITQAERLAEYHEENSGLKIKLVTPEKIYNEFSSGKPDASAIRDYIRMLYQRGKLLGDTLKYVLLFGDGSYDNVTTGAENTNFILTYQTAESLLGRSTYVSDDFFGLLDDNEGGNNGKIDIGVGRFPVTTPKEAENLVDKSINYNNPSMMGDWRNYLCFIADDHDGDNWDGNLHMRDANESAVYVEENYPVFNIDKIYLDAYQQENTSVGERYPEAEKAIDNRVQSGALIVNYTGHGGEYGLSHERVINMSQINSWKNEYLPLFLTATCEFSPYDNKNLTTAGEMVLLNPNGGGVALLSTTRIVYASSNKALNQSFYKVVFEPGADQKIKKLGDIFRETKVNTSGETNRRKFALLGDPALVLVRPKYHVKTDSINHVPVENYADTLKALSEVTIHGHLTDQYGGYLNTYNGILSSTIFDKEQQITTLGNERPDETFRFMARNNSIYKGKASIESGRFMFSFIVPKDISYSIGNGKISYYGDNQVTGACGYNEDIIIGGSSDTQIKDSAGPDIKLFMNDEKFVFGGITSENPKIYARIYDSTGINTSGAGIGHNIVAILNGEQQFNLNNYFEADLNSYKSGSLTYQLNDLEPGNHTLELKVWDILNNSSEEYLEFVVEESEKLALRRVYNYPNPFTEETGFYFEHNHANAELEVLIQILTVSGRLVKTIETTIMADGFKAGPIPENGWDGLDDFGDKIGRGVYIYRIKVRSSFGSVKEKYEKLVILK